MIKNVLITGKNGQLGRSLQSLITQKPELKIKYVFIFVGRDELDLSCPNSISSFFANQRFDAIINCAAYTFVDKAESEIDLANQINHLAVEQLAKIAKQQAIPLIHISTDYVFSGNSCKPYTEADLIDPQNVYGLTKANGELAMQRSRCAGAIIRTSWVYSEFGNNFLKTMLRLGQQLDSLNVIYDQIGCPTFATDLANAVLVVLDDETTYKKENCTISTLDSSLIVYHYSNEGVCSWYDFAKAIFELSKVSCQVYPIETKDYPTPAKRPSYSVLNKAKIKQIPGLTIPYWRDSLKQCLMLKL